jgi:hypothetical protein
MWVLGRARQLQPSNNSSSTREVPPPPNSPCRRRSRLTALPNPPGNPDKIYGSWSLYQSCPSVHHFRAPRYASVKRGNVRASTTRKKRRANASHRRAFSCFPVSLLPCLPASMRPCFDSNSTAQSASSATNHALQILTNHAVSNRHLAIRNRRNPLQIQQNAPL